MTDAEFAEIRYSGRPAAFLRGFRACYLALAINSIIIGWVTAAMAKIIGMTLNVGKVEATVGLFVLTGLYSTISGLWGVVVTDFFQFILAMSGCIALAFFALGAVGGMSGLLATLHTRFPDDAPLAFVPSLDSAWMPALTFFVYLAVNWWASWYPGAEPGGGGYVAQRILSTKNERHALLAALWFNIAHYALRPWPWIVVALVSMVLYPGLVDLLRWYWWRVNAWSEVSAMAAALVFSLVAQLGFGLSADDPRGFAYLLLVTTAATTIVWLAVTYLTPAEPLESLRAFHRRVRAGGPGWRAVAPDAAGGIAIGAGLVQWLLGCAVVYLALFGIGGLVLGRRGSGAPAVVAAVLLTWYLVTATRPAARTDTSVV